MGGILGVVTKSLTAGPSRWRQIRSILRRVVYGHMTYVTACLRRLHLSRVLSFASAVTFATDSAESSPQPYAVGMSGTGEAQEFIADSEDESMLVDPPLNAIGRVVGM